MAPPRVTVVGLGPGRPGLVSQEAQAALSGPAPVYLRTARHPSAALAAGAPSFDHLYESAPSLDEVYRGIVEELVAAATRHGEVVYAVPGSPSVAERAVELLQADIRVQTAVLPGVSFAEVAFSRLAVDPLAVGARLVDGHRFEVSVAGESGPWLVGQCDTPQVMSEVKLVVGEVLDYQPAQPEITVTVLQRVGLPDERVVQVPWYELDRGVVEPDHLTSVWVPRLPAPVAPEVARLAELGRALRQGCPWDREQTHQSLARYLVEETYEALEAIDELGPDGEGYDHLEEELGDVLFQVVFHAQLAAEQGRFNLADVARGAHDKLVARHPHVFGDVVVDSAADVARNWEQIKRSEKGRGEGGALQGVPKGLPSLLYSYKLQGRARSVGFDWPSAEEALGKVDEELGELRAELAGAGQGSREELGDLLFAVVNVARHLEVEPETALRDAANKFRHRFEAVEALAAARGLQLASMGLEAMDQLWEEVKAGEAGHGS